MCDIQYEEFDNKERIFQELRNMLIENEDKPQPIENNFISTINTNEDCNVNIIDNANMNDNVCQNLSTPKESIQPVRMSDLYSNFSSSWKDKLHSREQLVDSSTTYSTNDNKDVTESTDEEDDIDISDVDINSYIEDGIVEKFMIPKKRLIESSTCSLNDENLNHEVRKIAPKMTTTSSIGYNFDDEVNQTIHENKKDLSLKKQMVESSCDSFSDSAVIYRKSINRNLSSRNVAVASFGCNFEEGNQKTIKNKEMCTTSTETENCDKSPSQTTFTNQTNEVYNNLEEKILPFVKNPNTLELKLKGRVSVFQKACIKQISSQHKLMMKHFGKGQDSFILLRKKVELLNSQKLFLEMKKNDLKKQKERIATFKAKQEKLSNPPKTVSSGCQVDLQSEEKEPISKNEARRNRKMQWEHKQKQKLKKNSSSQTIEDGYYVCPYCEDDIPEQLQFIHYPHCLEKYRAKNQSKSNSKISSNQIKSFQPISSQRKNRSKSRDKINQSKIESLKKELEKVHDNDINAILNIVNESDKRCSISGCEKKKKKSCSICSGEYCINHFSPNDKNSDKHFNCPVALELIETQRLKKLGLNNPLLKTVEQLSSITSSDGIMINHKKRVKIVEQPNNINTNATNPNVTNTNVIQNAQNLFVSEINQTRTRNGPILSFERNNLKKDLKEKIAYMIDKRSK